MDKYLKWYFIFWFGFIFFIMFLSEFESSDSEESTGFNDYARITNVDYKAELVDDEKKGNKVIITEKLTFDVHAASKDNLFWELWRDLPEDEVDGLKIDYDVIYVKQINNDGTITPYKESPKLYWYDNDYTSSKYGPGKWYHSKGPYNEDLARYECVFFYVNGLYREKVTFEVQYIMNNAALRYSDVSELYLSMYSEETIKHLESFNGQILIPNKDMPKKGNYLAHTYGTNSHTFEYTESDTINPGYHTFSFDLDQDDLKFKNYNQYIEFSLLAFNEDKHIFTNYAKDNYYSDDVYLDEALDAIKEYDELPNVAKNNKIKLLINSSIISVLVLIFIIGRDKRIRKKHNFYTPSATMKYFRDIPSDLDPHFAATLVFSKHKHKIDIGDSYSALLLNLVRKEYIELEKIDNNKDWTSNNILIKILYDPSLEKLDNINTNNQIGIADLVNRTNNIEQNEEISITIPEVKIIERYNIKQKKLENLSSNEEKYFNLIVRHAQNNSISMKQFQNKVSFDYDNTDSFVTSVEKSIVDIGISQGYFQKSNYKNIKDKTRSLANTYIVFAIIIMTLGNLIISSTRLDLAYGALFILGLTLIISALYLKRISNKYVLLTQFGEDEYAKWRGLYNFLNSNTLMKERIVIELPLWEKYLVYATAFGISDKVVKALKIHCPNIQESTILSNNYYSSYNFKTSSRSFRTATRSASSMSRASRYSGGTYYGGGGRGGGGGGGGH